MSSLPKQVLALSGGIGGAKLALGLSKIVLDESLIVVANTGDDFEHFGLTICPDLDTLTYTLSGLSNQKLGWGRADETWTFMKAIADLGGESWFNLGDGDLAIHVERTRRLNAGMRLTEVTQAFCQSLGIKAQIIPMSDDPVRTIVHTQEGSLSFQHYFVRDQCKPVVTKIDFDGSESAQINPLFLNTLSDSNLEAIIICPSNPFISIDPILSLPGLSDALQTSPAPVIAVSPIIGDKAIKGPTAKIMKELNLSSSAVSVAKYYQHLLDGFVLDQVDEASAEEIEQLGMKVVVTNTLMNHLDDKVALAETVLEFAKQITQGESS